MLSSWGDIRFQGPLAVYNSDEVTPMGQVLVDVLQGLHVDARSSLDTVFRRIEWDS